ncbi:MAG: putative peptide zinc metalloprotease protein [Pirellulaceae bacterium]|jgi:putative peptide zinc metalloprotease protein
MSTLFELPRLRADIDLRQVGDGEYVVKIASSSKYFRIGVEEHFLLREIQDGADSVQLKDRFQAEFGDRLSDKDLDAFCDLLRSRKLVVGSVDTGSDEDEEGGSGIDPIGSQSIVFYKVPLVNPDRFLTKLVQKLPWLWTRGFVALAVLAWCLALSIVWTNTTQLGTAFSQAFTWETLLLGWFVVIVCTTIHEFAHGATCKKYGGEVKEMGALFLFFMPCMYCNVSDAWLLPEKSKRLMITAAGGFIDLCLWALAVFVWRITVQDSIINYTAFVVLTVCGTRGLINFNPLLRLDGYYLLSDALEIPNLRKRSLEYWMAHLRWILWGAERPQSELRGRTLLVYGIFTWVFAIIFLDLVVLRLFKFASTEFGMVGVILTGVILVFAMRRVFKGFFASEFVNMVRTRKMRTQGWIFLVVGGIASTYILPVQNYTTGNFEVRPGNRVDITSPVASFIGRIEVRDGQEVKAGDVLLSLHAPDLQTAIDIKEAELRQSQAMLRKLTLGPRPEEIREQEKRVQRLESYLALGKAEYERAENAHQHELRSVMFRTEQLKSEMAFAINAYKHSMNLYKVGALAGAELKAERMQLNRRRSELQQAEADYNRREATGTQAASALLDRREHEVADAESSLMILRLGTRPEEIAAENANLQRIEEQLAYLAHQKCRLVVTAPRDGIVSAARLSEKVGQFAPTGALLCQLEDSSTPTVELAVSEDEALRVEAGQHVYLKARALPFQTFAATVERIAPAAGKAQASTENVVLVHCKLEQSHELLKSGMTGFGRVERGWVTLGASVTRKVLRYVRTEFWW